MALYPHFSMVVGSSTMRMILSQGIEFLSYGNILADALQHLNSGRDPDHWWCVIVNGEGSHGLYLTLDELEMQGRTAYCFGLTDAPRSFCVPERTQRIYSYNSGA